MQKPLLPSVRPIARGLTNTTIIAAAVGHFVGGAWDAAWGVVTMFSWLGGSGSTAVRITLRDERFAGLSAGDARFQQWMWALPCLALALFTIWFDVTTLSQLTGLPLALLFGATGFTAYYLGVITGTLQEIAIGDPTADPRLNRLTTPPDRDRRSAA